MKLDEYLDVMEMQQDWEVKEEQEHEVRSAFSHVTENMSEADIEKTELTEDVVNDRVQLQNVVNKILYDRATSVVFYASSRDAVKRAASALNKFPTSLNLVYYL